MIDRVTDGTQDRNSRQSLFDWISGMFNDQNLAPDVIDFAIKLATGGHEGFGRQELEALVRKAKTKAKSTPRQYFIHLLKLQTHKLAVRWPFKGRPPGSTN